MADGLQVSTEDGVLTVVLDRPDRLNAVTSAVLARLVEVLDQAEADEDVRVVVVTGAGIAFCAGQDLEEFDATLAADEAEHRRQLAVYQAITDRVLSSAKPFVAAVNGVAVGFGAELALACDIRIAARSARLGFVEATRALFQTNGVMWLLPRTIGHGAAARMLLTGEIVDAEEALRIGLVSALHEDDDLAAATHALATRLRTNAPLSMRTVKQVLGVTWGEPLARVMEREVDGMLACFASEDLAEGTRAFLEKRPPAYRGR